MSTSRATIKNPVRRAGIEQSLLTGAEAFKDMMQAIKALSDATCNQFGDEVDGRDYVAMFSLVESSIRTNLTDAEALHREGYLRAFTDLLSIVGDGSGLSTPWEPIATTAPAFAWHRIGKAANPIPGRSAS